MAKIQLDKDEILAIMVALLIAWESAHYTKRAKYKILYDRLEKYVS